MNLNHLDLQVSDVPAAAAFFARYFDLERHSKATSPAIAILGDAAGFTLVLQRLKDDAQTYPDGFHIGFYVDSVAEVHARRERIAADHAVGEIITNNRGTMFYCRGPNGIVSEVNCRSRVP